MLPCQIRVGNRGILHLHVYSDRTGKNIGHSVNFHMVKHRYLIVFVASRYLRDVSMHAVVFHTTSSKDMSSHVFARGCVENYSVLTQNFSILVCCLQRQGICTSPHENSLSIKEEMNNFLTCPVQIQVQNNQNMSCDSSLCKWQFESVTFWAITEHPLSLAHTILHSFLTHSCLVYHKKNVFQTIAFLIQLFVVNHIYSAIRQGFSL